VCTRPLLCENSLVREADPSELNAAVPQMNKIISDVFFALVLLDRVVSQ
jgi:hypothetical protein